GGYTGLGEVLDRVRQWGLAETQDEQEKLARRAVALDPNNAEARSRLAVVLLLRGNHQDALAQANRALAASPNLAAAQGALGVVMTFSGQPKEGVNYLENCIRLDPFGPVVATRLSQVALAHYFCRE